MIARLTRWLDGWKHPDARPDTRDWLVARGVAVRERVRRVQQKQRRHDEPPPRDTSDAAIILENDRILRDIEISARRELAEVEQALARMAGGS